MTHFIFDCDDVLLDWQNAFAGFLADRDIHLDPAGPQSWNLAEWIGCSDEAARSWVIRFNGSASFGKLAAMPGAANVVWALADAGHTISVLTCCGNNASVGQRRVQNLVSEFGSMFRAITVLDLGESKFDSLASAANTHRDLVFVEDNFTHAQAGAVNGITSYCLRRSHNRRDETNNPDTAVMWIDDLTEIQRRHLIQKEAAE